MVRVWGCNGQVIEETLGLDRTARRQIQEGLRSAGFDPGGADGLFGPRTRAAIRNWQLSRGGRATGYLDGAAAEALRLAHVELVLSGGRLAMGRYEVTVAEYRAYASATGVSGGRCTGGGSWRDPGYPYGYSPTDRHPVSCVSWDDAQQYVSWLSRTTGARYRLPADAEWERAATGSQPGCHENRTGHEGPCPVGTYGANGAGLSDTLGNLYEWTADVTLSTCAVRVSPVRS